MPLVVWQEVSVHDLEVGDRCLFFLLLGKLYT